jgi:hypothetical protein
MSLVGETGNGYKYFSKRIKGHHLEYMNIHTRITVIGEPGRGMETEFI